MHFTIDRIDTTAMISLDLSFKCRYYRRIYRELFGEEYQSDCEEDDSLSASDSSDDKEDTQNDPEKAPWPQEIWSTTGSLYSRSSFLLRSDTFSLSLFCNSLSLCIRFTLFLEEDDVRFSNRNLILVSSMILSWILMRFYAAHPIYHLVMITP